MANTLDLTTPKVVTITNNAKKEEAFDAGSLQRSKLFLLADGTTIKSRDQMTDEEFATAKKIAYKNTDRQIQMYKTNTWVTIPQGDSVQITVQFPEELAYFLSLATDELSVVAVDATTEGETTPDPEADPGNP